MRYDITLCFALTPVFLYAATADDPAGNVGRQLRAATQPSSAPATRQESRWFVMRVHAGIWEAIIHNDGSGMVGPGATMDTRFPPGTFDQAAMIRRIRPQLAAENPDPHGWMGNWCWVLFGGTDAPDETLWAKDPTPIAEVFEQIRQAARADKASAPAVAELSRQWRAYPPTVISKAWDDAPEAGQ